MTDVRRGRFTADVSELGDELVVFMIGIRVNSPLRVRHW